MPPRAGGRAGGSGRGRGIRGAEVADASDETSSAADEVPAMMEVSGEVPIALRKPKRNVVTPSSYIPEGGAGQHSEAPSVAHPHASTMVCDFLSSSTSCFVSSNSHQSSFSL